MLQLGSKTMTIEGITVFSDHADPNQFWYLPGPVSLARRSDGRANFQIIKFKTAVDEAGGAGGGFLMFEACLTLDPNHERRILSRLRREAQGTPRLSVVPFDEGSVEAVALNLQGSGGTSAESSGGSFVAVEKILGASVPSLSGDNNAVFSLTLSKEGVEILEQALQQGTTPMGVIYNLKYSALRPALDVEITADFERIYNHFSTSLQAQIYYVQAGIDAGFEKLVQDGAIKIKVINYTNEADQNDKERWALDFFKNNLLNDWFKPSLTPGQLAGGLAQGESLDKIRARGDALRPPATAAPQRPSASDPVTPATSTRPAASASPTRGSGRGQAAGAVRPAARPANATDASPTSRTGFPTNSSTAPPAAAAGLGFQPRQRTNTAPGRAGADSGSNALVSFKLKMIRQGERKTVTLKYNRQQAIQRTYAPQGFIGLMAVDLDKSDKNYFVEVDTDSDFFKKFVVTADVNLDFSLIGLNSVDLSLDYGDPAIPNNHKHKDFVFDQDDHGEKRWEVFMNAERDLDYIETRQFHFNPQAGWVAKTSEYNLPAVPTKDRTLHINPYENMAFIQVRVAPNNIDWELIDMVRVKLNYSSLSGWQTEKTLMFQQGGAEQIWRLRTDDLGEDGRPFVKGYTYQVIYDMKDGSEKVTPPEETKATDLPIDDPFDHALNVDFQSVLDPTTTKKAFVDFQYMDEANDYARKERLDFNGGDFDLKPLRISVLDKDIDTFSYRITKIGVNNAVERGPFIETNDTLVIVE